MNKLLAVFLLIVWSLASLATTRAADETEPAYTDDIIARVGDESITFNQLNTMLNSSAIVGLSLPALGTPERDTVRLTLLDKVISANLLYLDAQKHGLAKTAAYRRALEGFSNGMLALVYRSKYLRGEIEVTDQEIRDYFDNNVAEGTEFTDEVKTSIGAVLRKQRLAEQTATLSDRLREGVKVVIHEQELDPAEDAIRDDTEIMATVNDEAIVWGVVKSTFSKPVNASSVEMRRKALDEMIDNRIMTQKARAAGVEKDPLYLARFNEFRKTRLINMHRGNLAHKMDPTEAEVRAYYEKNRDTIRIRAQRKLQIVVLETEEDAQAVKELLEAGTITMYQAAAEHSILPGARETLGVLGWVSEGTGFTELDGLAFSLGPGKVGGPVKTPNGWHLVKVMDVKDALYDDLEEEQTRRMVRRKLLKEKLNKYVVDLRLEDFPVEVYDDKLAYLMQKEIDWYQMKAEKGTQPPGKIYEQIDKLRGAASP